MRILTLGYDICRFPQAVVDWNNNTKQVILFHFVALDALFTVGLACLTLTAFIIKFCLFHHPKWLDDTCCCSRLCFFTFMLFISLFSFLLAIVILLVF